MPKLVKSLRGRLFVAGSLLVVVTIASATWSGMMFALLGGVIDETLRASEALLERAVTVTSGLEREDDALLLALAGQPELAARTLAAERRRVDAAYATLSETLRNADDRAIAESLADNIAAYRMHGDRLMDMAGEDDAQTHEYYHQNVNPALRRAVADGAHLREDAFRAMQETGVAARDGARRATRIVAGIAAAALLLSMLAALYLARTVLRPIRDLTESATALRHGDFEQRVPAGADDELGRLADEFNRMADSIAAFRRSNLGKVMRANDMLEATLRALPDAVIVVGPDGSVQSMNPTAKRLCSGSGEFESGTPITGLPLPANVTDNVCDALADRAATAPDVSEAFPITVDGSVRMMQPLLAPLPPLGSGPQGTLLVLHDVTDFLRLDALRADHIGVTSHELKTPLTTLRLNMLLLAEHADNLEPRQRAILATAAQGCEELSSKVERLLDLSRIEAGQLRLSMERLDLHAVIDDAVAPLRERFADEGVTLQIETGSELAMVRGDPVRLGLVIANLVGNGLKYAPRGGSVSVDVVPASASFRLTVTDTGPGVPTALRERIFEKFFRVEHLEGPKVPPVPGVGIGLYLSRQIVEAHGGTIVCEAPPDGAGARFTVELPA